MQESLSGLILKQKFPKVKGGFIGKNKDKEGYEPVAVHSFMQKALKLSKELERKVDELEEQFQMVNEELKLRQITSKTGSGSTEELNEIERKMEELETLERAYKRVYYQAEKEAAKIKEEAKKEADEIERAAQIKAEHLSKEANAYYEDRTKEADDIYSKAEEVREKLRTVADYITKEDAV